MKMRPFQPEQPGHLRRAIEHLGAALTEAKRADCPSLAKKIRSAVKSAGGAQRHMRRRQVHLAISQ